VGHDLYGEEFVAGKTVEADGPVLLIPMRLERREFFLFLSLSEPHVGRAARFIEEKRWSRTLVSEFLRAKELFFKSGCR